MERFWFGADAQWAPAGLLSEGERRRLQLLLTLVEQPNVLMLDEPTNDFDLDTLRALEDFLDDWPGHRRGGQPRPCVPRSHRHRGPRPRRSRAAPGGARRRGRVARRTRRQPAAADHRPRRTSLGEAGSAARPGCSGRWPQPEHLLRRPASGRPNGLRPRRATRRDAASWPSLPCVGSDHERLGRARRRSTGRAEEAIAAAEANGSPSAFIKIPIREKTSRKSPRPHRVDGWPPPRVSLRTSAGGAARHQTLHHGHVEPAVELAADLALDADELEAALGVERRGWPSPAASMRAITAWNPLTPGPRRRRRSEQQASRCRARCGRGRRTRSPRRSCGRPPAPCRATARRSRPLAVVAVDGARSPRTRPERADQPGPLVLRACAARGRTCWSWSCTSRL